jgi:hypothetical protein
MAEMGENGEFQGIPGKFGITSSPWVYIFIGVVVGLMYLTRADGLIWLGIAGVGIGVQGISMRRSMNGKKLGLRELKLVGLPLIITLVSFTAVISPLLLRNMNSFGSIFATGTSRGLWLIDYDELYAYPGSQLTYARWLNSGIFEIISSRTAALGMNLLNALAVQGGIVLLPLIVFGMWFRRTDWRVGLGVLAWFAIFLVMTILFPFQGARGGFFHSGATLQPLFWALVPAGLMAFIN